MAIWQNGMVTNAMIMDDKHFLYVLDVCACMLVLPALEFGDFRFHDSLDATKCDESFSKVLGTNP